MTFKPPFRVGKQNPITVWDANGLEVAVFSPGARDFARLYCKYLNLPEETTVETKNIESILDLGMKKERPNTMPSPPNDYQPTEMPQMPLSLNGLQAKISHLYQQVGSLRKRVYTLEQDKNK